MNNSCKWTCNILTFLPAYSHLKKRTTFPYLWLSHKSTAVTMQSNTWHFHTRINMSEQLLIAQVK